MVKRSIIEIDESKCDGCEQCVSACHEGAIAMVDGKAKLVSDVYCDGLGDCIGECPQDAITIIERDAEDFDEAAVQQRLAAQKRPDEPAAPTDPAPAPLRPLGGHGGGCPGSMMRMLQPEPQTAPKPASTTATPSALRNWPVQLHLLPVQAPFFKNAKVLLAADCVPFAHPDFHQSLLAGRALIIGCPKLDDTSAYLEKLTAIFRFNDIEAVEVAYMEVPCCRGLVQLATQAAEASGKSVPISLVRVGINGQLDAVQERASA